MIYAHIQRNFAVKPKYQSSVILPTSEIVTLSRNLSIVSPHIDRSFVQFVLDQSFDCAYRDRGHEIYILSTNRDKGEFCVCVAAGDGWFPTGTYSCPAMCMVHYYRC